MGFEPAASVSALQCSPSRAMETHLLEAGQSIEFINRSSHHFIYNLLCYREGANNRKKAKQQWEIHVAKYIMHIFLRNHRISNPSSDLSLAPV